MQIEVDLLKIMADARETLRSGGQDARTYQRLGDAIIKHENLLLYPISIACYQKSLQLHPHNPEIYLRMGQVYTRLGQQTEAITAYRTAMEMDPHSISAQFELLVNIFPTLYNNEAQIHAVRATYRDQLDHLCKSIDLNDLATVKHAADAVGIYPFLLAYQGLNDLDLQRSYGQLVCRIQAARYPQWCRPIAPPELPDGEPMRLGIVSAFFYRHATWNFPTRGLLEALDRRRFSLFGYHTGKRSDDYTDFARRSFFRFTDHEISFQRMCQKILDDRLHILIYPEIGMHKFTSRLAALRLAPIQCAFWGHSTTSGLPTMDFFLGSDLMEPANADSHYTETLVRVPNLSVYYVPPEIRSGDLNRAALGLRDDTVLYICTQNLVKYLPQYDDVFPQIAKQVGNCQFAFLTRKKSGPVVNLFRRRLAAAFSRHNLDSKKYTFILPPLDENAYNSLYRVADVFLDSIGWSGCNTTLDAIPNDLPVVTLPTGLMRGRQSMALLKMMGLAVTTAGSVEEYVQIAARLGRDAEWRQQIRTFTAENKYKIYRDRAPIEFLQTFFEQAIENASRQWNQG